MGIEPGIVWSIATFIYKEITGKNKDLLDAYRHDEMMTELRKLNTNMEDIKNLVGSKLPSKPTYLTIYKTTEASLTGMGFTLEEPVFISEDVSVEMDEQK